MSDFENGLLLALAIGYFLGLAVGLTTPRVVGRVLGHPPETRRKRGGEEDKLHTWAHTIVNGVTSSGWWCSRCKTYGGSKAMPAPDAFLPCEPHPSGTSPTPAADGNVGMQYEAALDHSPGCAIWKEDAAKCSCNKRGGSASHPLSGTTLTASDLPG